MSIEARLQEVRQRLQSAAAAVERDAGKVTLVAVSKTKSLEAMREYSAAAGRMAVPVVFGENYLQEIKRSAHSCRRMLSFT